MQKFNNQPNKKQILCMIKYYKNLIKKLNHNNMFQLIQCNKKMNKILKLRMKPNNLISKANLIKLLVKLKISYKKKEINHNNSRINNRLVNIKLNYR